MEIRKVTQTDDFNAIDRIYTLSWQTAYKNIIPQDLLDGLSEYQRSDNPQKSSNEEFVAIENGEYIGISSVRAARDEKMVGWGEIVAIYLLPKYFGKGFGKPLLEVSISALVSMGYDKIYLWTLEDNMQARKFYEKNGFSLCPDREVINIGGKDLVEVRYTYHMEKEA
ncbi:MAG: GNAT family N-acetyltransferase [Oscillospiraceae bacterium]|nr:GNAT family N-acetyltransferase [Oscillospiraceae bacterium]